MKTYIHTTIHTTDTHYTFMYIHDMNVAFVLRVYYMYVCMCTGIRYRRVDVKPTFATAVSVIKYQY